MNETGSFLGSIAKSYLIIYKSCICRYKYDINQMGVMNLDCFFHQQGRCAIGNILFILKPATKTMWSFTKTLLHTFYNSSNCKKTHSVCSTQLGTEYPHPLCIGTTSSPLTTFSQPPLFLTTHAVSSPNLPFQSSFNSVVSLPNLSARLTYL
jgi:hypothetical protein